MKKLRKLRVIAICAAAVIIIIAATAVLLYTGIIKFNDPPREKYPVRGVDVSHYQGKIDWAEIRRQGISFTFIKATEGSSYIDPYFEENFNNAPKSDIRAGAYHFFSFDSPGETQANNFIAAVKAFDGMLPPAVDVELYGKYVSQPPTDTDTIKKELHALLSALETEYGKRPIIYVTHKSYELLIKGDFDGYDIWIRDIWREPSLGSGREWTFWQYTNRGRLDGYDGEERYIDINVFSGSKDEFDSYGK